NTLYKIVLPHSMDDYDIFKSMYYGGRVLATVAKYDSALWYRVEHEELFDSDYYCSKSEFDLAMMGDLLSMEQPLKKVDVNSLYPFAMWDHEYPVGNYEFRDYHQPEEEARALNMLLENVDYGEANYDEEQNALLNESCNAWKETKKQEMKKACYQVDMDAKPEMI